MKRFNFLNENGIALVTALIISLVVMLLISGTIYFLVISTGIAGAGKRYSTAEEAADGAVQLMENAINLVMLGDRIEDLPFSDHSSCLVKSVIEGNKDCTVTLILPGIEIFKPYHADITVRRLYSIQSPGSDLDFAKSKGSSVFYRINTVVAGPDATRAETTVLYRYVN
ncbi:MAG: hypothetical protein HXY52_02325 [Nitrospirae bacterium]|jgi:Tfp pilus assembly protein PilX|nr:hypothetical protein [Nitrospirota bacterium]